MNMNKFANELLRLERRDSQLDRISLAYNNYYWRCQDEGWVDDKLKTLKDDFIEKVRSILREP
jgi:hypothetical protein